jgi:NAD(P)-dependent dehydrogenase (short-subunit alcohol dehydrogenase family)
MHVRQLFDLTGKVAFVTGGGRGLGEAMAEALAEAGASVAVASRRLEDCQAVADRLARETGVRTWAGALDVSDPQAIRDTVAAVEAALGPIDILVNNSGTSWGAPFEEMPLEKWEYVLRVNATGPFLLTQAVVGGMTARRWGRIINVASIAGMLGVDPRIMQATGYHASKGAVIAMTKDLAVKLAPHGVTVNAIAPGFMPTKMTRGVIRQAGDLIVQTVPMGYLGEPAEIKGAVVFLAGEASRYITGQVIPLDGGTTAW